MDDAGMSTPRHNDGSHEESGPPIPDLPLEEERASDSTGQPNGMGAQPVLLQESRVPRKFMRWLYELSTTRPEEPIPIQDVEDIPTEDDDKTFEVLKANEDTVDSAAQTQAKNWLAGITALIALVATASVLSKPDASDVSTDQLVGIVVLAVIGFLLLVASLWYAYQAAYGTPGIVNRVKINSAGGLRRYINALRQRVAAETYDRLKVGVRLAAAGVTAVLAATIVTWLPLSSGSGESTEICVMTTINGNQIEVLRTKDKSISASGISAGTVVMNCPP